MRISVLYNKPSARFTKDKTFVAAENDTEVSAHEVVAALEEKGATAVPVPVTEETIRQTTSALDTDLVFNLIEWTGSDTRYAMETFDELNARHIPYTGATKENYRDTCDKIITKRLCEKHNLPTAPWQEFVTGREEIGELAYPVIVKVASEHSSVGITRDAIASDAVHLRDIVRSRIAQYQAPVFAEAFLVGREFQITLLERPGGVTMLPPAEILYLKGTDVPLLTYESRWDETHTDYENSSVGLARLTPELSRNLTDICTRAYRDFGFRDYARFDIRCDTESRPYFLELNSNPGLGDDEDYGMTVSYKAIGMTFSGFIWKIVESAKRRYGL